MTETERIANEVYERHNPLPLRDWTAVHQAELEDQAHSINAYPLANLIMEKRRRRMSYTLIFIFAMGTMELFFLLLSELGCLDWLLYGGHR
jgi:hypothetical protein